MRVGEYCVREVAIASRETGVVEAAKVMRDQHVGDLIVVEERGDVRRPVAIVTDRDLVVEVLATGLDPATVTVADLATREIAVAREDDDLMNVLERMGSLGVRRMPVVDHSGGLAGVIAADDVIELIDELSGHLVKLMAREVAVEVRQRPGAPSADDTVRA